MRTGIETGNYYRLRGIRMKRILFSIAAVISLIVVIGATKSTVDLYDNYKNYVSIVKFTQNQFVLNMLSFDVRKKIKKLGKNQFPVLASFASTLATNKSHYQFIKGTKACLTVNGYDKNVKPASLYLEYRNEQKQWLLSFVELSYLDSDKDFKNKAECPDKF